MTWFTADCSIIRMSGFAFDELERWFPWQLDTCIERYVAAVRRLDEVRARVLDVLHQARVDEAVELKALRRIERDVRRTIEITAKMAELTTTLEPWNATVRD